MANNQTLELPSYSPSWVNRLADWLGQQRIPVWMIALALVLLEASILQGIAWYDGTNPYPTVGTVFILIPVWTWFSLVAIHYLNQEALNALARYRDLIPIDDNEYVLLKDRFTNAPSRYVILMGVLFNVIFLVVVFLIPSSLVSALNPTTLAALVVSGVLMFAIGTGFYYHVIHMLIMVDRTIKASLPFNLFDREPVFAFSELTARCSMAILGFATLNIILVPSSITEIGVLVFDVTLIPIGFAAFILPLWRAHGRLVVVKRDLQTDVEHRIKATIDKLHACLATEDTERLAFLSKAMTSLITERDLVDKIPTWPWRKGLFTGVASAVLLPTALIVIQIIVQRWFQP